MTEAVKVSITAGGQDFANWESATVSYSAKEAVRSFSFTATSNAGPIDASWQLMPQTPVTVTANGSLLVTGFIDKMSPSYAKDKHTLEVSGRSKGADTVDSSAEHSTGEIRNTNIQQIAQQLDKQSVGFSLGPGVSLDNIDVFRLNPGETVFQALDKVARKAQLLLIGQPDGSIQIATGGTTRTHPALIEGQNILEASAVFDDSDKHSEYKVKGQRANGTGATNLAIEGTSTDTSVKRNRPKVIIPEGDTDQKGADKRAKTHKDRQTGESITASIKVQGWHDDNGQVWAPNTLVYIYSPMLKLDMDLLLDSVSLTQDSSGSFSKLGFVQPKGLGSSAGTGSNTSGAWAQSDDPDDNS